MEYIQNFIHIILLNSIVVIYKLSFKDLVPIFRKYHSLYFRSHHLQFM